MKDIMYDQLSDIGGTRTGSEFVVSAWPNRANYPTAKWLKYPFVVLMANNDGQSNLTINKGLKEKTIAFTAEVYDKSQANADKMANQVNEVLDIAEGGLEGSGLHMFRVESISSGDIVDPGNAVVHVKTINWMYDYIATR